jgi:hypothetical protein
MSFPKIATRIFSKKGALNWVLQQNKLREPRLMIVDVKGQLFIRGLAG